MSYSFDLGLFGGFGIELEYMIVDAATLDVRPIADRLLCDSDGRVVNEVSRGAIAWSNELALHVIELKTNGPAASLSGLAGVFAASLDDVQTRLAAEGACLLPSAMHPWMDPQAELRLWPHGDDAIYRAFDRIFSCKGHGWANLQSMHINLPFANDEEFGRLHAAIRLVLPLLPAIAASSPLVEGRDTGLADSRLRVYRGNAKRIPSVTGRVIPERVFTREGYERAILEPIYRDLRPHDPDGLLQEEWVNARGCIARFDRGAIEIRTLDVQECPQADIAIAALVVRWLESLCAEAPSSQKAQAEYHEERLAEVMEQCIEDGDAAVIRDAAYLRDVGFPFGAARASEVWQHLCEELIVPWERGGEFLPALTVLWRDGCLASRIRRSLGPAPDLDAIGSTYRRLADCLRSGALFV